MYQIIQLQGTIEPWWAFEELSEDIIQITEYQQFNAALKAYKKLCLKYANQCPKFDSRKELMATFWDEKEQIWCEECGDMLQEYHSLVLLEDGHQLSHQYYRPGYSHDTEHPFPQ